MNINPYESPHNSGQSTARKSRLKMTLVEFLVVISIIGILIALLLPARRGAREPARRSQCMNNLKQIGLALRSYEEVYHALPPAYTVDADGTPLHSWRTLILPFIEQKPLYDRLDLSKPWNDPANKIGFEHGVPPYYCPSTGNAQTHTTYLAVVAPGGCFRPTQSRRLAEITDEPELTLVVVEVPAKRAVHWMSPTDTTESEIAILGAVAEPAHPNGDQALTLAGSVLTMSDWKPAKLRALISIAGNDDAIAGAD